jgi:hypothetical protein
MVRTIKGEKLTAKKREEIEKKVGLRDTSAKLARTEGKPVSEGIFFDKEKNITRYDYSKPYSPTKHSIEFFNFVNLIFGEQPNKTPKVHYMLIDHVTSNNQLEQVLAHRGLGKSELISNFMPLYVAYKGSFPGFGNVQNLVLFSDTISQAQEHLANMRMNYENSEYLQEVLTLVETKTIKPKVDVLVFDNKDGNRIFIQAKGAGESMRGTKKGKIRPQLLIFDDILNDDILESEVVRKKLHTWFFSTVSNSVDITHFKYVMINTPMTESDIVGLARVSKQWHTLELPVADDVNISIAQMVTSWRDRFTPKRVLQKLEEARSMGAQSQFYREMMLEITNKELALFQMNKIREFDYEDLRENFPKFLFFTAMDLAVSRKQSADFTFIITVAVDSDMNWYCVKMDHGRWDMQKTLDILFENHLKKYNPLKIGVERAAHQQVFNDFMLQRMIQEQIVKEIYPLNSNSQLAKETRIATLVPVINTGKLWIHKKTSPAKRELLHELDMMTREACLSQHDDGADCLASFTEQGFVVYPGEYRGTEIVGEDPFDLDDYTDSYY